MSQFLPTAMERRPIGSSGKAVEEDQPNSPDPVEASDKNSDLTRISAKAAVPHLPDVEDASNQNLDLPGTSGEGAVSHSPDLKEASDQNLDLPGTAAEAAVQCNDSSIKESIKILITGKGGTSKSVLINGLVGRELIKERSGVCNKPRPTDLQPYIEEANDKYLLEVYSFSYLQDQEKLSEQYLTDLRKKCSDVHLIIYCLKMTETRFLSDNPDIRAMKHLTKALGKDIWTTKTVFSLTSANVVAELIYSQVGQDSEEAVRKAFEERVKSWRSIIRDVLTTDINVELTGEITVVPAGHYEKVGLPGRNCWLQNFFSQCCSVMNEDTLRGFIEINKHRLSTSQNFNAKENEGKKINDHSLSLVKFLETCKVWGKNVLGVCQDS